MIADYCAENAIPFIDVSPDFAASSAPDLYADDTHPGPTGQRLIAQRVWLHLAPGLE